jgi:hypothetical protein
VGVAGVVVLDSLWVEMSCMLDDGWMELVDDEGALPNDVVFVKAGGGGAKGAWLDGLFAGSLGPGRGPEAS